MTTKEISKNATSATTVEEVVELKSWEPSQRVSEMAEKFTRLAKLDTSTGEVTLSSQAVSGVLPDGLDAKTIAKVDEARFDIAQAAVMALGNKASEQAKANAEQNDKSKVIPTVSLTAPLLGHSNLVAAVSTGGKTPGKMTVKINNIFESDENQSLDGLQAWMAGIFNKNKA